MTNNQKAKEILERAISTVSIKTDDVETVHAYYHDEMCNALDALEENKDKEEVKNIVGDDIALYPVIPRIKELLYDLSNILDKADLFQRVEIEELDTAGLNSLGADQFAQIVKFKDGLELWLAAHDLYEIDAFEAEDK
ncbi:hypothetical protein [Macrococcus brunensis]|uniref:hypothetical protein n=1 Tax=Macrococcus brunensis TaxID=198483 RepID=UPI001EF107A0|nr:hypothetical protein [Macrococcus brunensis]ULG71179.1 hypothetical protein MGG12_07445 [Macrococcus brunensis]